MLTTPMDVLKQFPVRKNKKQKQAFRDAVQAYAKEQGYSVKSEFTSMNGQNLVIGNPESAQYLVTAHYDTPAGLLFPNLITPCNPITFIAYQLFVVALFFLLALVVGFAVFFITEDSYLAFWAGYLAYFTALGLMMFGPANRNNANDNTSGVVTLLETMRTMPENQRSKVCFVLFDLEEAGLIGSAAYRKAHKAATNRQVVLNLDCVGDGNEIVLFPTPKLKKNSAKMDTLGKISGQFGVKSIALHRKGFSVYPSDQKNFPYGVGIAAFHRKKGVGLYCSRIHTHKDTVLEETNVNILRAALTTLISGSAAQ